MIFCFANLRPGKRWRKGFWLECEAQGLSAVIRNAGDNSEENELQIDVYAQKEQKMIVNNNGFHWTKFGIGKIRALKLSREKGVISIYNHLWT